MAGSTIKFRAAAVQAEPVWMDAAGTVQKTIDLMREAADGGAQLLAFPELWIPGYPGFMLTNNQAETIPYIIKYRQQSIAANGPEVAALQEAARTHQMAVAFGYSERDGDTLYMSQMLIDSDGAIKIQRRKLKPTRFERELFGQGDGSDLQVVETSLGRVGALNCAENTQSLNKFALAAAGEQIHISSWPFPLGEKVLVGDAMSAINAVYAKENGVFVLMSTLVVGPSALTAFGITEKDRPEQYLGGGYAKIFNPNMELLTEPLPPNEEGIVYADVDLSEIEIAKYMSDPTGHYARPDVFSVKIDRRKKPAYVDINDEPASEPGDQAG